jgi:1-deoxy-D-xylulose-5-phosphate synthase
MVMLMAGEHDIIVTVEENALLGGAGSAVNEALLAGHARNRIINLGIPDAFIGQGDHGQQLTECGLDTAGILAAIESLESDVAQALQVAGLQAGKQLNI